MKKLVCIATVMLCLAACFVPCLAAPDLIFTLRAEQQQNENVKLGVNISKDSALYTSEFFISYDENALEFIEKKAAAGEITAELNSFFSATKISDGRIKVSYTSSKALDSSGTLCTLEFRAEKDSYVNFNIEVDHAETFDGEHIRSLSTQTVPTSTDVTEQFHLGTGAVIAIIGAGCAVIIAIVILFKNKKSK